MKSSHALMVAEQAMLTRSMSIEEAAKLLEQADEVDLDKRTAKGRLFDFFIGSHRWSRVIYRTLKTVPRETEDEGFNKAEVAHIVVLGWVQYSKPEVLLSALVKYIDEHQDK